MNYHIEEHRVVQESITDALFLLMDVKPFVDISITELIQKAGIARSTYYRNYTSKEDVLAKYIRSIFDEFGLEYPTNTLAERTQPKYANHVLNFVIRYQDRIRILKKSGYSSMFLTVMNSFFLEQYGSPDMSATEMLQLYAIAGAEYNLIFNWFPSQDIPDSALFQKYIEDHLM